VKADLVKDNMDETLAPSAFSEAITELAKNSGRWYDSDVEEGGGADE